MRIALLVAPKQESPLLESACQSRPVRFRTFSTSNQNCVEPNPWTCVYAGSAALRSTGRIVMDRLHFFTPVRIARGQGYPLEEVDSVSEAMVFLRKWPTGRRGPVYQCAVNCCSAAMAGKMSAEEARKAFVGFARITRILDDEMALPLGGVSMDNVYALRR
ncbi:DUF982 domain-containing protein [Mesorhizobium sp. M1A.F.Ca.IN.020.06.1.1]|uniref:DUF982 domain-containing protein n=2 Tax=unclassified Mesorhizobium TaxID=325217 RepID=UPI0032AFC709